jgi:hypothetical protein
MLKNNLDSILKEIKENEVTEIDVSKYKFKHSVHSNIEPMMSNSDYEALINDIKLRGCLNQPVIIVNNAILDGRNRQKACIELNIPMKALYLKNAYTREVLNEYVRSIHMHRNKKQSQLLIQAYRFKKTVANVTWAEAAQKYGVTERSVQRINSLYNELAKHGLQDDFEKIENAFFMGLTLLPSSYEWLSKPTGSASSAIKQLREYMDNYEQAKEEDFVDTTEIDPVTGETLDKEKNYYMGESKDVHEELQQALTRIDELEALVNKLMTKLKGE